MPQDKENEKSTTKSESDPKNIWQDPLSEQKQARFWTLVAIIFFISSVVLGFFVWLIFSGPNNNKAVEILRLLSQRWGHNSAISDQPVAIALAPRLIDGVFAPIEEQNRLLWAIMIDNQIDARPPAGLSRASMVIAAEAEGGINRFLAVYAPTLALEEIGPIRSARPYFIDCAHEFDALYVHVGGSPEALVKLKKENIFHLNEFYNDDSFWRSAKFNAPHNVFTSSQNLNAYYQENSNPEPTYFSWRFKDDLLVADRPASSHITISQLDEN